MRDLDRYFEILDIQPGASLEEIKRAYRELIKVWHPDRFATDARLRMKAEERTKALNEAYRVLRARYEEIQAGGPGRPTPGDGSVRGRGPRQPPPPPVREPSPSAARSRQAKRRGRESPSSVPGWLVAGAVLALAGVLVYKGALSDWVMPARPQAGRGAAAGAGYIVVDLLEWAVKLETPTAHPGLVQIWVHNRGTIEHNLVLRGTPYRIDALPAGGSETLTAMLDPGTYFVVCDIPGHIQSGMAGVLHVR